MGTSNSKTDTDTINWNNIKTDNMSINPNFNGLSNEARQLIASLNIPEITESPVSEFSVNNIIDKIHSGLNQDDKNKFNQILDQVSSQTAGDDLSATSPFISSEMYNYLINSKSSEENQTGGAIKTKKQTGGALDDESDTSSTSSDSDLEDILDSTEEGIKAEKAKGKKHKKSDDSELSGGELSYLSSSAHTGGDFSDSDSKSSSYKKASSVESTSETQTSDKSTVTDENGYHGATTDSVNTEDINMVSDY